MLRHSKKADLLRAMQAQEQHHLDTFAEMIARRRVRPTAMLPLWHLAGFALGAASALLGERAAMACTVAWPRRRSTRTMPPRPPIWVTTSRTCGPRSRRSAARRSEHRDIGLAHEAERAPGYRVLSRLIKAGCRTAIAISERV